MLPLILLLPVVLGFQQQDDHVSLVHQQGEQRVDVLVDGELFTSYLYSDVIPVLKKPVLFPVRTARGTAVTRGYPLEPRGGERVDHPHQIGFWLNYGDVNGFDFWNNSDALSPERAARSGIIRHRFIKTLESDKGRGILEVSTDWNSPDGRLLLVEDTRFVFRAEGDSRIIDRTTTLTAPDERVAMTDNKEGMIAMRVARELEHPSSGSVRLTDAGGRPMEENVTHNDGVSGSYWSSEGLTGEDVWGKRAPWVALSGVIGDESVTLAMYDHPQNPGYPTYWHARGYGLFSANPLGQKAFSDGAEELNLVVEQGESITFKYRFLVHSGESTFGDMQAVYDQFIN